MSTQKHSGTILENLPQGAYIHDAGKQLLNNWKKDLMTVSYS
jgi:hypothetical protein